MRPLRRKSRVILGLFRKMWYDKDKLERSAGKRSCDTRADMKWKGERPMAMELERAALELVERKVRGYVEHPGLGPGRAALTEGTDWTGKDCLEALYGRARLYVDGMELIPSSLGEGLCLVTGAAAVRGEDPSRRTAALRVSALCLCVEDEMRLLHVHTSVQAEPSASGPERSPADGWGPGADLLSLDLPGAIICCDNSPELRLLQYSEGFLRLAGYTREEVRDRFDGQLAGMILPEDLERTRGQIGEQLSRGADREVEYRIRRKDGAVIWVLDRGRLVRKGDGKGAFHCILMDETQDKHARQKLQDSLERYQIISSQTNDVIFEWDLEHDTVRYSENWRQKFGYPPLLDTPEAGTQWDERIHPEDRENLYELARRVKSGVPYAEAEARISNAEGRHSWYRIRITLQHLEGGTRRRAVGIVIDIDSIKRQTQKLRRMAEQDTLTGIYNRRTAQELIAQKLEGMVPGEMGALFVLDVDDFKLVNDRYGHLGGDAVLTDIAGALKGSFRGEDIVARIGGDEFCVYLSGVRSREILAQKAEEMLKLFRRLMEREDRHCLSCSIGVAVSPQDGEDYHSLFRHADAALYCAKDKGKNQVTFYVHGMGWSERKGTTLVRERGEIESERGEGFQSGDLAGYVFRTLYEADDVGKAIALLLEIIGKKMRVSRAYIFELEEDGQYLRNTFEWCDEQTQPEIGNLQRVELESIKDSIDVLKEKGALYIRDVSKLPKESGTRMILEPQGIHAMLQCAVRSGGTFKGTVGFDECRGAYVWTKEQVEVLSLVADIVGTFLVRYRAQEKAERVAEDLTAILNHQQACIYVVDPDTHAVLFVNDRTRKAAPELRLGDTCYRAFFGNDTPCPVCPLGDEQADGTGRRIFSRLLGREVEAVATEIPWRGRRGAYLISCYPVEGEGGGSG